jgi:Transposase IS66 family
LSAPLRRSQRSVSANYASSGSAGQDETCCMSTDVNRKSLVADEAIIDTIVSKYADHCPLDRQGAILLRDAGIEITRTTMCGWVMTVGEMRSPVTSRPTKPRLTWPRTPCVRDWTQELDPYWQPSSRPARGRYSLRYRKLPPARHPGAKISGRHPARSRRHLHTERHRTHAQSLGGQEIERGFASHCRS